MDETNVATTESEVALKRPEGPGADELLFALAAVAPLVRAADGRLHARVPVNDRLSRTRGNRCGAGVIKPSSAASAAGFRLFSRRGATHVGAKSCG